jgi:hypothetical protein
MPLTFGESLVPQKSLSNAARNLRIHEVIRQIEVHFNINSVSGVESGVVTAFCHRTPNGCGIMDDLWDFITVLVIEKHCNERWAESIWSARGRAKRRHRFSFVNNGLPSKRKSPAH